MSSNHNEHPSHTTTYVIVFIILLSLTALTVHTGTNHEIRLYLGKAAIYLALLIATIKATLVALIFMHLKDDAKFNKMVFSFGLVFLFIFVSLTLSDVLTRPERGAYAKVIPIHEPEGNQLSKMNEWRKTSPERVEKGKILFTANCVACHGAAGLGDGPAGAGFNPKPRNFTSTNDKEWINGRAPSQIFKTLKEGARQMPSTFSTLPAEDRWNLVHYVRSLSQNPPEDTPATLAAIGLGEGAAATPKDPNEGIEIPVSFAMDRLMQEASKK